MAGVTVHHIAFRTRDLARLQRFYTDVIGLALRTEASEGRVWLAAGATIVMLERADDGEPARGWDHDVVAFAVTQDERRAVEARASDAGVSLDGGTAFTTYLRDPDGRRVAVSHYPDRG